MSAEAKTQLILVGLTSILTMDERKSDWRKQVRIAPVTLTEHTILDGRRLRFDGTGGQLFGNYIKWFLLTIITLGIYGFWLNIKMKQWVVKHTHII